MTESESVALPLGDAAIFSTSVIITDSFAFVNTKMKISPKSFFFFKYCVKSRHLYGKSCVLARNCRNLTRIFAREGLQNGNECGIMTRYAPVAQLDRAQASDAWCRRFKSCSVRHKNRGMPEWVSLYSYRPPSPIRTSPFCDARSKSAMACAGGANR